MSSFTTVPEALAAYEHGLARQPLANHTRRTYLIQVRRYCTYLSMLHWEYGHPLQEPHARDYAVRDYKIALKTVHHAKPSTVNLALAAIDHFYRFLELPPPRVTREDLPAQAPRALEPSEQKRFLRAVECCASVRNRAIALLLFYTAQSRDTCKNRSATRSRASSCEAERTSPGVLPPVPYQDMRLEQSDGVKLLGQCSLTL